MKTSNNFIKNVCIPSLLKVELYKNAYRRKILWLKGVANSWYFPIPKNISISITKTNLILKLSNCNFMYTNNQLKRILFETNKFLTLLQKIITGLGPGYHDFITLRARKCILDIKKKFIQTKICSPFFINQRTYSIFKTITKLKNRSKTGTGKARFEQRMPILKIQSKSLNFIKHWIILLRKRERPNFYTGQGIRFLKDIAMNREEHAWKWKERKLKKSGKKKNYGHKHRFYKKIIKKYAYILANK